MRRRFSTDSGRQATTLLASAFVVLLGATATAAMLLAVVEQPGWRDWAVWGATFGGAVLLLHSLHRPIATRFRWQSLGFWLQMQDRTDPLATYKFRKRRSNRQEPYGTNQPPTLESLRDADDSPVRWVPHGPDPERPPRRQGHS